MRRHVQWSGVDGACAQATLTDATTAVTLEFRFGADGLIAQVWAASRPRSATVSAPWLCMVGDYEGRAGMRVPVQGDVERQLPNGPAPYFRGRVTHMDYEFAVPRRRAARQKSNPT